MRRLPNMLLNIGFLFACLYLPGKIEYPSLEELARFERAAERMSDPSPSSETGN